MFVKMFVPDCDFDGLHFEGRIDGAGAVSRGASGRYCVVMYAGPEYLKRNNIVPLDLDEAYSIIDEREDGYADF